MMKIITVLLTLVIVLSSSMAFADKDEAIDVMADALVFKPLGFAALVSGSVIFVITLPIAAITDSIDTTSKVLVKDPFDYVFVRPIGEIKSNL
ncbi:MAG: hypothetical protein HY757_06595 [Nitrospirae bacterium]|nr:hypothetical protein [Nitrospirota bacterium]